MKTLFLVLAFLFLSVEFSFAAENSTLNKSPTPSDKLLLAAMGDSISLAFYANPLMPMANYQLSWSTGLLLYGFGGESIANHLREILSITPFKKMSTINLSEFKAGTKEVLNQGTKMGSETPTVITIEIGSNEICQSNYTPASEQNISNLMTLLLQRNPPPKAIILASVPNLSRLSREKFLPHCKITQNLECPALDKYASSIEKQVKEFNQSLRSIAQKFKGVVFYDNDAVFNYNFSWQDLSIDCFHPSVLGQAHLAEAVWGNVKNRVFEKLTR